jgi:hypothetical protein
VSTLVSADAAARRARRGGGGAAVRPLLPHADLCRGARRGRRPSAPPHRAPSTLLVRQAFTAEQLLAAAARFNRTVAEGSGWAGYANGSWVGDAPPPEYTFTEFHPPRYRGPRLPTALGLRSREG